MFLPLIFENHCDAFLFSTIKILNSAPGNLRCSVIHQDFLFSFMHYVHHKTSTETNM